MSNSWGEQEAAYETGDQTPTFELDDIHFDGQSDDDEDETESETFARTSQGSLQRMREYPQ